MANKRIPEDHSQDKKHTYELQHSGNQIKYVEIFFCNNQKRYDVGARRQIAIVPRAQTDNKYLAKSNRGRPR